MNMLVDYLSIGEAKGDNRSVICPGKGGGGGGGGGGTQLRFIQEGPAPRFNHLLIYTIFDRKWTPFVYPLLTNGAPFTYLV